MFPSTPTGITSLPPNYRDVAITDFCAAVPNNLVFPGSETLYGYDGTPLESSSTGWYIIMSMASINATSCPKLDFGTNVARQICYERMLNYVKDCKFHSS